MTVKERQFREQTTAAILAVQHQVHPTLNHQRLTNRPGFHAINDFLTLAIVVIDHIVRWLEVGKAVDLKADARVTGTHDAVSGELVRVAKVAIEAHFSAHNRIFKRTKPVFDIHIVGRATDMKAHPGRRSRPMACFTADTISQNELRAALIGRHIVRVTVEAFFRLMCIFQTKIFGDALRTRLKKNLISARMFIVFLPSNIFVQQNRRTGRSDLPVATA